MCSIDIRPYRPFDRDRLLEIWERSVEASHDFLKAEDFQTIKSLVKDLDFSDFEVYCAWQNDQITGFLGLSDGKIEMLFVEPMHFRKGIGRAFIHFAIQKRGADSVDVNEQNINAVDFYKSFGFEIIERSELDDQGHPYPILKMALVRSEDTV